MVSTRRTYKNALADRKIGNLFVPTLKPTLLCLATAFLLACSSDDNPEFQAAIPQESQDIQDPGSYFSDLTKDAIIPPEQATLSISTEPGALAFSWSAIPGMQTATIYKLDNLAGIEELVVQTDDSTVQSIKLPSRTHQRAWYGELFRVELCDVNDCVSSERVSISELMNGSLQRIYPGVFVRDETFAKSIALNASASLMAVSSPTQGAIDLYTRPDGLWQNTQRINLDTNTEPEQRTIDLSLSASGDTLAALFMDAQQTTELKIIERFGEAWFETTSQNLTETTQEDPVLLAAANEANSSTTATNRLQSDSVSISKDGDSVLMSIDGKLLSSTRTIAGWSTPMQLVQSAHNTESSLKAVTTSTDHSRMFTLHSLDQNLSLSVWARNDATASGWEKHAAYAINNLNADRDVYLRSDSTGAQVALAGWELNSDTQYTPVLWRFDVPPTSPNSSIATDAVLASTDSLRYPFSAASEAVLRFSADTSLDQVVLGWQIDVRNDATSEATNATTASSTSTTTLMTYQSNETTTRWRPKLELSSAESMAALASQINSLVLSPDGSSMVIGLGANETTDADNRVGAIVAFQ